MDKKILSIMTNFGCHWGCRYCIYRENGINIPSTDYRTFGWNELEEQLKLQQSAKSPLLQMWDGQHTIHRKLDEYVYKYIDLSIINKYEVHTYFINKGERLNDK